MKTKLSLWILALAVVLSSLAFIQCSPSSEERRSLSRQSEPSQPANPAAHVPAHFETAPSLASLPPTLDAAMFNGKTRQAYKAAGEIPRTLAQLPCYCHCDRGMGHKSLHSCFEDDHAAHCVVCVDEALLAYRLEKEGLTAPQIRDRIVAEYSRQ